MAHGLAQIRWAAPWLAPYREVGEPLAQAVLAGRSNAEVLDAAGSPRRSSLRNWPGFWR